MAEKRVNTRIQNKHDTEANFNNATFSPLPGEIIVYDKDATHTKPRIKVGDGETPVTGLPFVVDKEETDRQISEINSKALVAINDVDVSGRTLTFTKNDGTSFNITTQDTDLDEKVKNTKNNAAKAYVTGTTSSTTNTGTQIFDTNIYIDSTAGQLVATTFKGNLTGKASKATADASGNTITSTYETKSAASSKLAEAKSYTDTTTANMNKESYLLWGGRNLAGTFGPLDASLVPELGANRLAFLPSSAVQLQTSTDGGSNWTSIANDAMERKMFANGGASLFIGNSTATGIDKTNYKSRVIITTTNEVYSALNKFIIYVSTNGSTGCHCKIEARTYENYETGNDVWTTFVERAELQGWSGYNVINLPYAMTTHGNSPEQYAQIKFTFGVDSHASSVNYGGLIVNQIMAFGGVGWATPSTMASTGHLYSYDHDKNASFPANVTAARFNGPLQGNAASATRASLDADGNSIVSTYATKTELEGLISFGTADPTSSTPGRLYIKYLP